MEKPPSVDPRRSDFSLLNSTLVPENGISREELDSADSANAVATAQSGCFALTLATGAPHDGHVIDSSKARDDAHLTELEIVDTVIDIVLRSALTDVQQLAKQQFFPLSRR